MISRTRSTRSARATTALGTHVRMWVARIAIPTIVLAIAGCAAEVVRQPALLTPSDPTSARHYFLSTAVSPRLDTGFHRTIGGGTEFVEFGRIDRGRVLRPVDSVITIEGRNMHEAYPVVDGESLVGFYLPVEKAFTVLTRVERFPLEEREYRK